MSADYSHDKAVIEFQLLKSELISKGFISKECKDEKFGLKHLVNSKLTEEGNNTIGVISLLLWPRPDSKSNRIFSYLESNEDRSSCSNEINSSTPVLSIHDCCCYSLRIIKGKCPNTGDLASRCALFFMRYCNDPMIRNITQRFERGKKEFFHEPFSFEQIKHSLLASQERDESESSKTRLDKKVNRLEKILSLIDKMLREKLLEKQEEGHMFSTSFYTHLEHLRECFKEAIDYLKEDIPIDISAQLIVDLASLLTKEEQECNDYNHAKSYLHMKMTYIEKIVNTE